MNKGLLSLLILLLGAQLSFGWSYTAKDQRLSDNHPLMIHLQKVHDENRFMLDESFWGEVKIRVERDSNSQAYNPTFVSLAHPHYDSLFFKGLMNAPDSLFQDLDMNTKYSVSFDIGVNNDNSTYTMARIRFADANYKKAVKQLRKLYAKCPYNSYIVYMLGKSLDKLEDPEGMDLIRKGAKWGDEDCIEYLNLKFKKREKG